MPRATVPLASLLLLAALPGCGDSTDVSYRRTAGETLVYVRSVDVDGTNPQTGVKARVRQEVTTRETTLEIIPGDRTTVEVQLDRIVMAMFRDGPDPVAGFDTAKPGDPKAVPEKEEPAGMPESEEGQFSYMTAPVRSLAGAKVELVQVPAGQVVRMDRAEDLRKRVLEAVPAGDPRRKVAENMPWGSWVANYYRPAVVVQPRGMTVGDDVRFRDLRTLPETTGTRGYMYYSGTYRLSKVVDGVALLEMQSDVALDPPSPDVPPWPPDVAPRRRFLRLAKGTCKAWARIRVATGVLEEDEHVTDLDLHFIKPDGTGEVPIPTKVTQRSKLVK